MDDFSDRAPAHILVVDDQPENLQLLTEILTGCNYRVTTCSSGEEALRLAVDHSPDMVLLDIMLPGLDGYEVCRRLKENPGSSDLPVIMLSALNDVQDKILGFRAGAVDYIQKPWRTEEMMIRLETHLARRRMSQALKEQNWRLQREIRQRKRSQELADRHRQDLERKNQELAALYRISQALSRTIELDDLFTEILHALREVIAADLKGGIFLVEEGKLRLASAISLTEMNLQPCKEISFGECLCGLSAERGEIVISENSTRDPRHERCTPGLGEHGHVILPLKTREGFVVGILNLYTLPDKEIASGVRMLLEAVSIQIGDAVQNARRFEESQRFSLYDPLTGLANRRFLGLQQEALLESALRYNDPFSVIMLDIDHFKLYNDHNGHPEGDRVLIQVAKILRRESRHADHVFRLGGEEFLIVLPRIDIHDARRAAERLREAAEAQSGVTLSLGVAAWEEGVDMEDLIRDADSALYQAKQQGRNRVKVMLPGERRSALADQ